MHVFSYVCPQYYTNAVQWFLPRDNGKLYIVKFPDGESSDPQG